LKPSPSRSTNSLTPESPAVRSKLRAKKRARKVIKLAEIVTLDMSFTDVAFLQ